MSAAQPFTTETWQSLPRRLVAHRGAGAAVAAASVHARFTLLAFLAIFATISSERSFVFRTGLRPEDIEAGKVDAASISDDVVHYYRTPSSIPGPDAILRAPGDRVVRTFALFDTLIARAVSQPEDVFRIVQQRLHLPLDYAAVRHAAVAQAPANDSCWDSIFSSLQSHYGWSDSQRNAAQAEEIQAEHDVVIPIARNLARVRHDDLLVSDTCLPRAVVHSLLKAVVHSLLKAVGFARRYYLLVTVAGKEEGSAWGQLLSQGWHVSLHLGDNYHADVVQARAAGIAAEHTHEAAPTAAEAALLASPGWEVHAQRLRRVRLENPYWLDAAAQHAEGASHGGGLGYGNSAALSAAEVQAQAWDEFTRIHLPLYVYVSRRIDERMQAEGLSRVLFLASDGAALRSVFDTLYAWRGYSSASLWASRLPVGEELPSASACNCSADADSSDAHTGTPPAGPRSSTVVSSCCNLGVGDDPYLSYLRRMNFAPHATLIMDMNGQLESESQLALNRRVAMAAGTAAKTAAAIAGVAVGAANVSVDGSLEQSTSGPAAAESGLAAEVTVPSPPSAGGTDGTGAVNVLLLRHDRRTSSLPRGVSYVFDERVPAVLQHVAFDVVSPAAHVGYGPAGINGVLPVSAVELPSDNNNVLVAAALARAARRFVGWLPPAPADGGHDTNRTDEAAVLSLLTQPEAQAEGLAVDAPLTTLLSPEVVHARTAGCLICPGTKPDRPDAQLQAQSLDAVYELQSRWEAGMGNVLLLPPPPAPIRGVAPGLDGKPVAVRLVHDAFLNRGYLYLVSVPYDVAGPLDPRAVEVTVLSPAPPPGMSARAEVAHYAAVTAMQTPSNLRSSVLALRHPVFEAPTATQVTVLLKLNDTFFRRVVEETVVVRRTPLSRSGSVAACVTIGFDQGLLRLWTAFHRLVGITDFYIYYHGEAGDPRLLALMHKLQRLRGVRATFIPVPIWPFYTGLAQPPSPRMRAAAHNSSSADDPAAGEPSDEDGPLFGPATPSNDHMHHHVQIPALQSCLYRYHHRHDAMVFVDVDEILLPGPGKGEASSAPGPGAGSGATTLPQLLERLPLGWESARVRMAWAKLMPPRKRAADAAASAASQRSDGTEVAPGTSESAQAVVHDEDHDIGLEHLLTRRLMRLPSTNHDVRMKVIVNTRAAAFIHIDAIAARAAGTAAMKAQKPVPFLVFAHFLLPARSVILAEADIVMLHMRNRRLNETVAMREHEDDLIESHPLAIEERRPVELLARRGLVSVGE